MDERKQGKMDGKRESKMDMERPSGAGRWKMSSEEANLLEGAENAFSCLSSAATRLATGGELDIDVSPEGWLGRLAQRAEAYANVHPFPHPDFQDPLGMLKPAVKGLPRLAAATQVDAERDVRAALAEMGHGGVKAGERIFEDGQFERTRVNLAIELAAQFKMLQAVAGMRVDALFERERLVVEAEARLEAERAKTAEARGDVKAMRSHLKEERKWGRSARELEVANCIHSGMRLEEIAEKFGKGKSTVSRLYAAFRKAHPELNVPQLKRGRPARIDAVGRRGKRVGLHDGRKDYGAVRMD